MVPPRPGARPRVRPGPACPGASAASFEAEPWNLGRRRRFLEQAGPRTAMRQATTVARLGNPSFDLAAPAWLGASWTAVQHELDVRRSVV